MEVSLRRISLELMGGGRVRPNSWGDGGVVFVGEVFDGFGLGGGVFVLGEAGVFD